MKRVSRFVWERKSSFSFTITSILFGFYHFLKPTLLSTSGAYEAVDYVLGLLSGRYLGLLFIVIATIKLYGIITDRTQLRLSLYFALLFLWTLLAVGFFISFLQGNDNTAWITISGFIGLSTNIIDSKPTIKPLSTGRRIDD